MKATSVHIVLLAIFMYGVLSTAYLYGQTKKSPTSDLRDKAAADSRTVDASTADNDKSADYRTIHVKYASVEILAKQLKDLLPATTVAISDDRTSQIIVRGPKDGIEMAESLIKDLDIADPAQKNNFGPMGPPLGGGSGRLTLIGPPAIALMGGNASGVSALDPNGMPDLQKAWEAYTNLALGNEELLKKDVLKDRELLDQFRASGEVESATKVLGVIQHLLHEQARRAEENAKRADEQAQQAKQKAQKAEAANDDQQRQAADELRRAADDARRSAEQVRRTVEELQRGLTGKSVAEQSQRRNEEIKKAIEANQRAMEAGQQIAAISATIRNLESSGDLSDKQKSSLDEAKRQLKDRLSTQFDERQKQESEELKQLHKRLDKLEKNISDRSQDREKIINQQIDELTSAFPSSSTEGTTLTSDNLTLENLQGANGIRFHVTGPVTITQPVPPVAPVVPIKAKVHAATNIGNVPVEADAEKSRDAVDSVESNKNPVQKSADSK